MEFKCALVCQFNSGKDSFVSHIHCVVSNTQQQQKGKQPLSLPNIYCKCPSVMEANGTSWMDYKFREKQFWNINVAWIYWGSTALHLSPMASPSCCLPDCGPLKWTDLGHACVCSPIWSARPCIGVFVWWSFSLCRLKRCCQSAIHFWLARYNVRLDFLSPYYE